jgi:phenylalanyl-tRNA synthetase alpha chain
MQKLHNILYSIYESIDSSYEEVLFNLKENLQKEINDCEDIIFLQKTKNTLLDVIKQYLTSLKHENNLELRKKKSVILNEVKQLVFSLYQEKVKSFNDTSKVIDKKKIFLPISNKMGKLHPLTITKNKIYNIMQSMRFTWVDAPEVDEVANVFDKLNMNNLHSAREEQQSFSFKNFSKIPRTHCTNFQAKILDNWNEEVNLQCFHFGNVYRCDSDATHTPKFTQFEVFFLNKEKANLSTLMGFIDTFFEEFFGFEVKTRVRTSYFPFTEISYEVDILLNNRWLEIGGCGMVHENVFIANKKNFVSAWAWGMGIERLTMIAGSYLDIRKFYSNDIRSY